MALSRITNGGVASSGLPSGSILQIQSTSITDPSTMGTWTNSSTWGELNTAFRCSITPSKSDSKLLLEAEIPYNQYAVAAVSLVHAAFYDVTNSAYVFIGDASGSRNRCTSAQRDSHADVNDADTMRLRAMVDASNTTARTYTIYWHPENTASYRFGQSNNDTSSYGWTAPFLFTIKEIAG